MTPFQGVCRLWAVVFGAAGLAFLLAPGQVAALLDALAGLLGGSPGVLAGRASLWYPLALSLMAVLAWLAWEAGRPGAPPLAFRALVLSKLVSTFGFAALAVTSAGAWWLCAGADGFVALTLLLARRAAPREGS